MSDLSQFRAEIVKSSLITTTKTPPWGSEFQRGNFNGTNYTDNNVTDSTSNQYNLLPFAECTLSNVKNNTVYISGTWALGYSYTYHVILSCYRNTVDANQNTLTNLVGRISCKGDNSTNSDTFPFSIVDSNAGTSPTYYWAFNTENGNSLKFYTANTSIDYKHGSYLDLT